MELFKEIGLTAAEEKVYLALLELGDATRGDIVSTSGVAGSKIYELLIRLQEKGLAASYLKNNVRHFKATHPNQLLSYLEEKQASLHKIQEQTALLLPQLLAKYSASKQEQEIALLSGLKGLEIIFREQVELLTKGEVCYVIGGTWGSNEDIETAVQSFFQKVHMMREERGIKTQMLFNKRQKSTTEKLYTTKTYHSTKTRYIDHTSPVAINVYRDRTIIIIFGKEISAIHITSEEVAKSFVEYFNLLWESAEK